MQWCRKTVLVWLGFGLWLANGGMARGAALQQEYVTTTPVVANGVLYVASSITPWHRGHLRAIDILDTFPVTLWDAADRVPLAGTGATPGDQTDSDPPARVQAGNLYRTLFTNLGRALLPLAIDQVENLQPALGVTSRAEAELLLHAVRGRRGGSLAQVAGLSEDPQRLWSISRSSPVLVGHSPVSEALGQRDQVLYAGAEDGMLHAFFVSRWQAGDGHYQVDDPDGGVELWAYLPGSFLPYLKAQPLDDNGAELAVHLDGTAVVKEHFLDLDGDGHRKWHTLLVATGTMVQSRRSCLFVIDISNPYQPELLWEKTLPGNIVGRSRGIIVAGGSPTSGPLSRIYLTAGFAEGFGTGIHALAVDLETGEALWQFSASYPASGPVAGATPAVPALMDSDADGNKDTLVFGDLVGRLWALDLRDGHAYDDGPIFVVPGGVAEPIGAGVAIQGRVAIFGTGGVEYSDDHYRYAIYAVEFLPDGSRLRWVYPLMLGEKVWETPAIDASGNLLFGTAVDYLSLASPEIQETSGRIISLNRDGEETDSRQAGAATLGRVVIAPGLVVSVALTGEVTQFGAASRLDGTADGEGTVKILSWRPR